MNKMLLILFSGLGLLSVAQAEDTQNGFYTGIGIGNYNLKNETSGSRSQINKEIEYTQYTINKFSDFKRNSLAGSVFLGYSYYLSESISTDLQVELIGTKSTNKDKLVIPSVNIGYDIDLFGKNLKPYVGAGYHYTDSKSDLKKNGLVLRAGLDYELTKKTSVGLVFNKIDHGKTKSNLTMVNFKVKF